MCAPRSWASPACPPCRACCLRCRACVWSGPASKRPRNARTMSSPSSKGKLLAAFALDRWRSPWQLESLAASTCSHFSRPSLDVRCSLAPRCSTVPTPSLRLPLWRACTAARCCPTFLAATSPCSSGHFLRYPQSASRNNGFDSKRPFKDNHDPDAGYRAASCFGLHCRRKSALSAMCLVHRLLIECE